LSVAKCLVVVNNISAVMARTSYFWWDDDEIFFLLDQCAELDFYNAGSLKQQSEGGNVTPFW